MLGRITKAVPVFALCVCVAAVCLIAFSSVGLGQSRVGTGKDFESLAADYVRMRSERDGAPDERIPRLSDWGAAMHTTMSDLGERAVAERVRERRLVALLGEPDKIARSGDRHATVRVPPHEHHVLYWWRGGHDYLYFVIRRGRVADARWWYAGE